MKGKTVLLLSLLISVIALTACSPQQFKTTLFKPFENETSVGPRALAWDGRDLVLGALNQVVTARNIKTQWIAIANDKMDAPNYYLHGQYPNQSMAEISVCGMAWEGDCCEYGYLWIADQANQAIIKVDYNHTELNSFPSPGPTPSGMTYDGENLWVADEKEGAIYKITTTDGTILETYKSPIRYPSGLAWDGQGGLWVVGMEAVRRSQTHSVNPQLVKMNLDAGMTNEKLDLPKQLTRPGSLEWVDGIIWVGDQTANMVFKLSQKNAAQLGESDAKKIERVM